MAALNEDLESQNIMIYPLTQNKVLAEALCFKGAYQSTNYYAVLDDKTEQT